MTDKPIVYSGQMVRKLFAGVKTNTRRIVKAPAWSTGEMEAQDDHVEAIATVSGCFGDVPHIYQPGDRLWIKENIRAVVDANEYSRVEYLADGHIAEIENTMDAADLWMDLYHYGKKTGAVVSSRFMPKWASRATLIVESVKYENLHDITREDAILEGITRGDDGWWGYGDTPAECNLCATPEEAYRELWIDIHGKDSWNANPIVVVPTFTFAATNILKL